MSEYRVISGLSHLCNNNSNTYQMKFSFSVYVGVAIVLIMGSACGPSQVQLAKKKINIAETLLIKGDTINALLYLDSIPRAYPEARAEALSAMQLKNKIYTAKLLKEREILSSAQSVISTLIKDFSPEKGEFEKYTSYIHKRLENNKNWSRSFIQVFLNEKGDLSVASNYYGELWLNHTSIQILGEGITAATDSIPLDNIDNHHSEFNGAKWERLTYRGPKADLLVAAIAANFTKRLKSVFKGKSSYIIWLDESDKKAIKEAFDLSNAFKAKNEAEKMIAELEKKTKS